MRTFTAVNLPEGLKKKIGLIQEDLKKSLSGKVKWVEENNLHLTMLFLGDMQEEDVKNYSQKLERDIKDITSFKILIKGLSIFPNIKRPHLFWLEIQEGRDKIRELFKKIQMSGKDYLKEDSEHSFKAHITLGRVKDSLKINDSFNTEEWKGKTAGEAIITSVDIMQSTLTENGPVYKIYKEIGLVNHV
ncbi:MAG: RNA 2',3'-cyclic phosphodiesterase [Elusimicrobiota bacterium]